MLWSMVGSLTATSFVGIVAFAWLKKWIENSFDQRLENIKKQNSEELSRLSAQIEMVKRQNTMLVEARMQTYPVIAEAVYGARNALRSGIKKLEHNKLSGESIGILHREIEEHGRAVELLLYKHRLIIDNQMFRYVHEYKNRLLAISGAVDDIESRHARSNIIKGLSDAYVDLDRLLELIINILQHQLGVLDIEKLSI